MSKLLLLSLLGALALPTAAGAQISDEMLANQVAERILTYPRFSIFDDVNVFVKNRDVQLTGWVTTPFKKKEIEARVDRIDGIRSLANDIVVLPNSPADSRLRVQVANAIYNHPTFWQYAQMSNPPIHIIIENGRITLTGVVNSEVERMLAYSLAQVGGSFGVTNNLVVPPRRR